VSSSPPVVAVVPALDEAATIGAVVAGAAASCDEVVVVDNASADPTAARAAAAGARVVREPRRGYGAACLTGALAADPAAVLLFLDGDGSDDPGALNAVTGPVLAGEADLVLGSRAPGRGGASPGPCAATRWRPTGRWPESSARPGART
jgi:glycosyltransferase involved in cell wall biosynthesis